jgi:ATP-binding cassette subfamily F protein uup
MPILDAQGLRKSYGARTLLDDVSLTIVRGEKVGIVGDNGAGKSTLAKIMAGAESADQGVLHPRKGARISYLSQDPQFEPGVTAREAALAGLGPWLEAHDRHDALCEEIGRASTEKGSEAKLASLLKEQEEVTGQIEHLGGWARKSEADRVLRTLGIEHLDQEVATMSGGERRRVALAQLLISEPDLAILDEPTNHLDADTVEWLEDYLKNVFVGAVLLVTHDRWLLNNVVARTLEVEAGQVHSYDGGWEDFLLAREERRAHEKREEANRQNFLRKEIEWLRRQPKARGGKQKARIGRAEAAIENAPRKDSSKLELDLSQQRLGGNILEARDIEVSVEGRVLLSNFSFQLLKKQRVGIIGKSGAGKTTLLKTLLGARDPSSGEVILGKNTKIAYLDQMRDGLNQEETVFDAITGGRPSVTLGETDISSYSYLKRFRFEGETVRQKVSALSGGERSRVALARLLLSKANVLVLDEPTNDLDVMTLGALEDLILGLQGAALIVSHDRYFLDRIATSVLALDGLGGAEHIQGGYSDFHEFQLQKKKDRRASERSDRKEQSASSPPPEKNTSSSPRKTKLTYAERLELERLPSELEKLGAKVSDLETQLADPSLYTDRHQEAPKIEAKLAAARATLEKTETRWLELEEKNEA